MEGKSIDVVIPGLEEFEWMAIRSAATVAAQAGFSASRIEDVKTVVGEAFLNAIKHGNRNRPERRVVIRYFLQPDAISIEVVDRGRGFDPDRIPEPQIRKKMDHEQPPGGWGLFLIRRLVNHLEVHRRFPFGSRLRITMRAEIGT